MRKLSLFLLLASAAAVPALAAPGDDNGNGRHHRDSNSSEQSESRPQRVREVQQSNGAEQRSFRAQRVERNQTQQVEQTRVQPVERSQSSESFDQTHQRFRQLRQQQSQEATAQSNVRERARDWRQQNDGAQTNWQARQRQVRTIPDSNVVRGPSSAERQAYQNRHRTDYRNGNYSRWTNNWRNNNRYNWSSYRNQHRSIFRIGIYSDPFGWNYRPWSIGSYLYPSYYGQSYWLNDPWQYRLPPAYGPYRWVRYWDDALLVNIYTGQVEDVIHNFFW